IELAIKLRGSLLNVMVDGQHMLAYRLPISRRMGQVDLIAYAATADFLNFELATLPDSIKLLESNPADAVAKKNMNPEQARSAIRLAELTLKAALLEPDLLKARFEADRARLLEGPAKAKELALKAAAREKQAALARAEEDLGRAELEFLL